MKKPTISTDLRRRIVDAYERGLTQTYAETAKIFGVGTATVSRLLRRDRETGDVLPKPRGGNYKPVVDDAWALEHAKASPDATLTERVLAWDEHSGRKVSRSAMANALARIGWSYKKDTARHGT